LSVLRCTGCGSIWGRGRQGALVEPHGDYRGRSGVSLHQHTAAERMEMEMRKQGAKGNGNGNIRTTLMVVQYEEEPARAFPTSNVATARSPVCGSASVFARLARPYPLERGVPILWRFQHDDDERSHCTCHARLFNQMEGKGERTDRAYPLPTAQLLYRTVDRGWVHSRAAKCLDELTVTERSLAENTLLWNERRPSAGLDAR